MHAQTILLAAMYLREQFLLVNTLLTGFPIYYELGIVVLINLILAIITLFKTAYIICNNTEHTMLDRLCRCADKIRFLG